MSEFDPVPTKRMCVYVCTCIVYVGLCMCVCMYVCMYVCVYVCMYICVYVCICACVGMCVCVCVYMCVYIYSPVQHRAAVFHRNLLRGISRVAVSSSSVR